MTGVEMKTFRVTLAVLLILLAVSMGFIGISTSEETDNGGISMLCRDGWFVPKKLYADISTLGGTPYVTGVSFSQKALIDHHGGGCPSSLNDRAFESLAFVGLGICVAASSYGNGFRRRFGAATGVVLVITCAWFATAIGPYGPGLLAATASGLFLLLGGVQQRRPKGVPPVDRTPDNQA